MRNLSRRHFVALSATAPAVAQTRAYETPIGEVNRPGRNLLSGTYTEEKLADMLAPREEWKPFPTARERAQWDELPAETKTALLANGESHQTSEWPSLPATYFLDYVRIGNRTKADDVRRTRRNKLRELVLAECVEGRGRFLDDILNGIWLICEESYWGSPAHLTAQRAGSGLPDVEEPTVDLFAADTAAALAWVDYLIGPRLEEMSPLIRPRIWHEVDRRVLTPCEKRNDFWWMGLSPGGPRRALNNWTPWIDSNWLSANLLLERDNDRRIRMTHKILRSLDRFLESYHDDGGCDEGPGYWNRAGGSLFDCLELLDSVSAGAIGVFDDHLIREIGRYIVRAHIHDVWFVNFADASAKVRPDGSLVYRYGRSIGDRNMQMFGSWVAAETREGYSGKTKSLGRELTALSQLEELRSAPGGQPLLRDVWLPGIEMMAARIAEGSPKGLYVAAHGGHNAESHNHNDVGDFIVYADGRPAIIDIGVETYTAKTFSSERYEIWTMQSVWHNLPTIGGAMQFAGRRAAARDVKHRADDSGSELSLDIAPAYADEAGIESWKRSVRLDRERNQVVVTDRYSLQKTPPEITQTFMTPGPDVRASRGKVEFAGVAVEFDSKLFEAKIEKVPVEDSRLKASWGDTLYRVLLRNANPAAQAEWRFVVSQRA